MRTQAVLLRSPWEAGPPLSPGTLIKGESPRTAQQGLSAGHPTTPPPPVPAPPMHTPAVTCPCTMAFSRASTACRASGGRSGCSMSSTAFQSASTACCHQQGGDSN